MQNFTLNYHDINPLVEQDNDYLEFTPIFADTILSVVPTSLVLGASVARIVFLWHKQNRLQGLTLQYSKLLCLGTYACSQLALSICWATLVSSPPWSAVLAVNLSLLSAITFCLLSYLEHGRSIKPSSILLLYLFFSIGFDILHLRASWPFLSHSVIAKLTITSIVLKATSLVFEAVEKAHYLPRDFYEFRPEELSSILNKGVFFWINRLMRAGARSVLVPSALYKLDSRLCTDHLDLCFEKSWRSAKLEKKKHRLGRALCYATGEQILQTAVPRLALLGLTVCQPLLIRKLLEYLQESSGTEPVTNGQTIVAAYSLVFFGMAVSSGFYWHSHYRFLSMVRGCLASALNRRVSNIDIRSVSDPKTTLTLMSADIDRITEGLRDLHEFWANTIQICIVTYILSTQLGVASLVPIVVACIAAGAVTMTSKATGPRQKRWMEAVDHRVSLTSSILSNMKEAKMKGLTVLLTQLTQDLRVKELHFASRSRMLVLITNVFAWSPDLVSPMATFIVFYLQARSTGTTFDSTRAFTSLSLIMLLAQQLKRSFIGLPPFFAALACLRRIETFLCAEEHHDLRNVSLIPISTHESWAETSGQARSRTSRAPKHVDSEVSSFDITVRVKNGSFGWVSGRDVLKNINIALPTAKMSCIIGPVASGKSTLCKVILGEICPSSGEVEVMTSMGGIAFCDQTPHLMNRSIKQNVIGFTTFDQAWYDTVIRSVALEEDISVLPNKDNSIVGSGGGNLSGGQRHKVALARALYSRKQIVILDDVFSGLDAESATHIAHHVLGPRGLARRHNLTMILATHAAKLLLLADHVVVLNGSGEIEAEGPLDNIRRQSTYVQSLKLEKSQFSEIKSQVMSLASTKNKQPPAQPVTAIPNHDRARQTGDFAVYGFYFRAAGILSAAFLLIWAVAFSASINAPTVWLKAWADTATREHGPGKPLYPAVYACIQCLGLIFLAGLFFQALMIVVTKAGRSLHNTLLEAVMAIPLSALSKTDVGLLINRFSQDMNLIDVQLAFGILYLPGVISMAAGQAIVIAISNPWTAITFPFVLLTLYYIQKFYLRTSRQLRLLAIEAKGPLYTHFLESVTGIATLRAFGWTQETFVAGQTLLDNSQRPSYLLYMIRRWLIFVLDTLVACLATVVAAIAITQRINSGFAGVALSQLVTFSQTLSFIIIDWTDVETSIGAVSRIKSFSEDTPSENKATEVVEPSTDWPSRGKIDFRSVSSTYDENAEDEQILKNINLVISPGEKVGICGRSGSGKSSTILTLLRMLEITEGTILVDDVDLGSVPRSTVRSRFNTLPQHPFFLRGTVRMNLDLTRKSPDADLMNALAKVGLKHVFTNEHGAVDLDENFRPETLSHGQRQLFALAGALLRKSQVVILDEVTSNVDSVTDALMQKIIREQFAGCTIVAIAHRLNTIIDFDRVLVLSNGRLVESGKPTDLLKKQGSIFKSMWETGVNHHDEGGTTIDEDAINQQAP